MARLVVYLAAGPGAGKTRRLLQDAKRHQSAGKRVAIGRLDTHGEAELEQLAQLFSRVEPDAALDSKPDVIVLDDLVDWKGALALREAGIGVVTSFNISQLETIAPVAMQLTGSPVAQTIPLSFLKSADEVIALDASPSIVRSRAGRPTLDEPTLAHLRELVLRTVDDLSVPTLSAANVSAALAILLPQMDAASFLRRSAPVAAALDLRLNVLPSPSVRREDVECVAGQYRATVLASQDPQKLNLASLQASMLAVPNGSLAAKLVNTKVERDIFIVDSTQSFLEQSAFTTPLSATLGDRMRVGYGKLTVYLGAAAGVGKTMAMLDRGHQLRAGGVDVVIGLVEPHGRAETEAAIGNLDVVARKTYTLDGVSRTEMDRDAILARKPAVVLVDELAHTNVPGSPGPKRFQDVLAFLRAGIDVITTLNVQHLESLGDAVHRLTGSSVRETLPDGILPLANDVILVDVAPEELRERMRAGKIYPRERIEGALANFFRAETLAALRELALREALRAETHERIAAPFKRLLVSVIARNDDMLLVRKASRIAARLEADFAIAHVAERKDKVDELLFAELERTARSLNAEFSSDRVDDAAKRVLEISRAVPETTVAVGGTLRTPRWPARNAFARRLLDAGARELVVLARPTPIAQAFADDDA